MYHHELPPKKKKSSQESFSGFPKLICETVFHRCLDEILDDQETDPSNMIDLIQMPPELIEEVFFSLVRPLNGNYFPNGTILEGPKRKFVEALFDPIVFRVRQEFEIERGKLAIEDNRFLNPNEQSTFLTNSAGIPDFVVRRKGLLRQINLIIIEVKSGDLDEGVLQGGLYMVRECERDGGKRTVYGCCSNAKYCNFMSYNPLDEPKKRFKVLYGLPTMLPGMEKFEKVKKKNERGETIEETVYLKKDEWVKKCKEIPQLVYSCLVKQLKEDKETENSIRSFPDEFEDDFADHPGKTLLLTVFKARQMDSFLTANSVLFISPPPSLTDPFHLSLFKEDETYWSSKMIEHMSAYFDKLSSKKASELRLTSEDDLIYSAFKAYFPQFKLDQILEASLISDEAKWREFSSKFANKIEDSECPTMLRLNSADGYSPSNTFLTTRIKFLAIEIARNKEGFNDSILEKFGNCSG